jgi:hypothetical protein
MGSYIISSGRDFRPGLTEPPYTAVAGHPDMTNLCAAIGLFNRAGSGRKVTVHEVFFRDLSSPNSTTLTNIDFKRITAYTGGENILIPQKMDSNNDDLPSQIIAVEDADSVTSSVIEYRRLVNLPFYSASQTTLNRPGTLTPGNTRENLSPANFLYFNFQRASAVQGIILREGEGFAIAPKSNLVYQTIRYKVIVKFRKVSNNHCYTFSEMITTGADAVPFVLFNGSGSGVVLEIYHVDLIEVGVNTVPYLFSVERIEGIDAHSGFEDSVIASLDPNNESLSGLVDYKLEVPVTKAGYKSGALMSQPILKRDWQTTIGCAMPSPNASFGSMNASFLIPHNDLSEIVLHEGEGIAVFKRVPSSIGKSSIKITFSVDIIAVSGGGVRNYAYIG